MLLRARTFKDLTGMGLSRRRWKSDQFISAEEMCRTRIAWRGLAGASKSIDGGRLLDASFLLDASWMPTKINNNTRYLRYRDCVRY